MNDAVIGFLGVIAGAMTTGAVAWVNDFLRRGRELQVAAIRCADRLKKIAQDPGAESEYDYLGGDMNEYLSRIGAAPTRPRFSEHYAFYELLRPVLMTHEQTALGAALDAAKDLADTPAPRWPWTRSRLP